MRIAVITFFQSQDNYGQLLQCFALQKVLREMGHRPFVIRYGFHQEFFHWFKRKNFLTKKGLKVTYHRIKELIWPSMAFCERGFDSFRNKHLIQSVRCYNSLAELQRNPPNADCYISGSDQVWAQLLSNDNNRSFFLDFGADNVRRISYAPSFAMNDYPQELKGRLSDQLKKFDAISVREQSGVRICESLGFDAKLVLDPTLLLEVSNYEQVMDKPAIFNYCFIYHVNVTSKEELYWDVFFEFNKNVGYQSIASFANPQDEVNMEFLDGAEYVYPSIEKWLGYISQSKYVLTSSFHGLVFSVLFHKPFVVCLRKESMFAGNDRVMTLLRMLQLEDRIMNDSVNPADILSKSIDWDAIDVTLNRNREESLRFLKTNLSR